MTDTVKLEKAIADSGLKKARIAGELNITYQTLKRKINNEVPFNAGEISKMCDLLRISNLNDKEAIFFCSRCRQIVHMKQRRVIRICLLSSVGGREVMK